MSNKKIYFAASIRGGRQDVDIYVSLVSYLKTLRTVLTEHCGNKYLSEDGEDYDPSFIHDRDIAWMSEADIIVAEVTQPSLGVGYEMRYAAELGKPTLCLYRGTLKKLSAMLTGQKHFTCASYENLEDAQKIIDEFLAKHKN